VEAFFFFLLDVACWSLRLYFAALADWTAARGEDVWNGRRKDGGAIALGAARKRVVGEALVRHEGQYRCAAMVAEDISIDRTATLSGLPSGIRDACRQNVESRSGGELGPVVGTCSDIVFKDPISFLSLQTALYCDNKPSKRTVRDSTREQDQIRDFLNSISHLPLSASFLLVTNRQSKPLWEQLSFTQFSELIDYT
jgi:hypothetical protein